jgi:GGDEF domain-containing protein
MTEIYRNLCNDDYLKNKTFSYSFSFGIVSVSSDTNMTASEILRIADMRMYENKRIRKKERQKQAA